jgi:TonB dependent receptor-like, beta-barrel/TonB-dependent Receptor Plug Domain
MLRVLYIVLYLPVAGLAAEGAFFSYMGRPVGAVIDGFREAGYSFAYSTNLVPDDLLVTIEPTSADPPDIVRQVLEPHGLTLRFESDIYLVVRIEKPPAAVTNAAEAIVPAVEAPLEMITVSASRYEISRDIAASKFAIDQRTIQDMPDIGEDPIRIAQRIPGAAASGTTAKTHFRGGEEGEIGIMLNGQLLFEPFHVRDYQNIFSSIDSRAIEGVEVYTGGFPVRYGDRMSGMLLLKSLEPMQPRRNEIGVSVFNTSVLTAGSTSDLSWLFSARRSNLDIVLDSRFGEPSYYDVLAEVAYDFSGDTRLSVNALFADDSVELVLDSHLDEQERIESDTRNAQFWLQLDSRWSPKLTSSTVLSLTSFRSRRDGIVSEADKLIGSVLDNRDIRQWGLRQEWTWDSSERHLVQWGLQGLFSQANYNYASTVQYFGLPALYQGLPDSTGKQVLAAPEGGSYAIYFSDRWQLAPATTIEWGLRWDDQTYTGLVSDSQLSPRLSVLQSAGPRTEFRFSWGRYYQSQGIQELQVEDGLSNFWPAQRADHMIAGVRQRIGDDYSLRVELFRKDVGRIRPRFENLFNPLALIPELEPDRVRLDPESAKSEGLEISIDRSTRQWNWWASYTLAKATDRIDGEDVARSWDQRHAFQGGFGWSNQAWSFSAAASVRSGWPTSELTLVPGGIDGGGNTTDVLVPGPRNAVRYGTFSSFDVRLSRRFKVRRGSLLAFIEISNLANRRNECCLEWDLVDDENGNQVLERSVNYWLPLLPAFGVLWEF